MAVGACAPATNRPRLDLIVERGTVVAGRGSVAELARGPALLHVYTQSVGGTVFIAPAAGGKCTAGGAASAPVRAQLEPDQRLTVALRADEVMCLHSDARRAVEVLWHAHRISPATADGGKATLATRR
jgi:hypothetical protein